MYYEKSVNIPRLTEEIRVSSITVALDYINSSGSACDIVFKANLSTNETTTLDGIVAAHVASPLLPMAIPVVNVSSTPFIGSKTIVINGITKNLFARYTGVQKVLTAGENEIIYTGTFPWVKLVGIEVVNSEALDVVSLRVYDNASGTFSGVPNQLLNQFAYSINLPKDYYIRFAKFDADLYASMVIKIAYTSVSGKTVGVNFIMNEVKS